MSAVPATRPFGAIVPEMFHGPRRLQRLMPGLRRLPVPLARQLLVALAIGDGLARSDRRRRVRRWAAAHRAGAGRLALMLELLANHGRFLGDEAMLGFDDLDRLRRTVRVEGAWRLDHLASGALLLGFHLGPPRPVYLLRALGYPVRPTGRLEWIGDDDRWRDAMRAGEVVRLPSGAPAGRAEGLNRIRHLLRQGGLVYMAADGFFGREAFRIPVPGAVMILRRGWLSIRRLSGVPTLPVLSYREHGRRTIVIHPPLPAPDPDPARDAEACRAALAPLLEDYVRRFPGQCRYLVFPSWRRDIDRALSDLSEA